MRKTTYQQANVGTIQVTVPPPEAIGFNLTEHYRRYYLLALKG